MEFALIAPLLVALVLGGVVLLGLFNAKIAAAVAANQAGRDYAINQSAGRAQCAAWRALHGTLLLGAVAGCEVATQQWDAGTQCDVIVYSAGSMPTDPPDTRCSVEVLAPGAPADTVEVRVTYWQQVFVPGLLKLLGGTSNLGAQGTDRIPLTSTVVYRREQ